MSTLGKHWKIKDTSKMKGRHPMAGFKKGYKSWLGKKRPPFSEEWKRKLSESNKGKTTWNKGLVREKCFLWKGNAPLKEQIRKSFRNRQWISDIFTRDDFTCQNCLKRGSDLEAHHIKEFYKIIEENNIKTFDETLNCDELWNLNNGITLCKRCHNQTKHGGKKI